MRERDHLGDPGEDGRIIQRWIFQEVECRGMDWIELAQDRDKLRACKCGNELSGCIKSGNFLTTCEPVSFSRRTLLHGVSNKEVSLPILYKKITGPSD